MIFTNWLLHFSESNCRIDDKATLTCCTTVSWPREMLSSMEESSAEKGKIRLNESSIETITLPGKSDSDF